MRGKSLKGVLNETAQTVYSESESVGGEMGNGKWIQKYMSTNA
jgi:hypothetical protein